MVNLNKRNIAGYNIYKELYTVGDRQYLHLTKSNKSYFYRAIDGNFTTLDEHDIHLLFHATGMKPESPPEKTKTKVTSKLFTGVVVVSILLVLNTASHSYTFKSLPELASNELLKLITQEHQIREEIRPHFEKFESVMDETFAGFEIGTPSGRLMSVGIQSDEYFRERLPTYAAVFGQYDNSITLREGQNISIIYHELIHERAPNFIDGNLGIALDEAIVAEISDELFVLDQSYLNERALMRMMIEIVGFENVILPFIDGGDIHDVINAIDRIANERGYGHELINHMDNFLVETTDKALPTHHLTDAQIMLIDLQFLEFGNRVREGITNTELISMVEQVLGLDHLLVTDGILNLGADEIPDYYFDKFQEFLNTLDEPSRDLVRGYIREFQSNKDLRDEIRERYLSRYYITDGLHAIRQQDSPLSR